MKNYTTFPLKATPLSPLHIGNGEQLTSTGEFLTTSEYVYFLQYEALINQLKKAQLFDEYIEKILATDKKFDFFQVLTDWDISPTDLVDKKIKLNQFNLNPANNNVLQRCIKMNEQAYIPGSTLKGVFRTALIFKHFKDNPKKLNQLNQEIDSYLNQGKSLRDINAYWTKKESKIIPVEIAQTFRFYDSSGAGIDKLIIEQTNRQNFYGEDSDGLDWLVECINIATELNLELTLLSDFQDAAFHFLKTDKIPAIFAIFNQYSLVLLQQEMALVEQSKKVPTIKKRLLTQLNDYKNLIETSDNQYGICRIGKGKTLFFQTILPLLVETNQMDILALRFKETENFPRSRVLTVKDKWMMGWVKLSLQ